MVNIITIVEEKTILIIHKYVRYLFMKGVKTMYLTLFTKTEN